MKALYMLSALAAVGCSDITSPSNLTPQKPANEVIANFKEPSDLEMTACNGETVFLTGEHHFEMKSENNDRKGSFKIEITDHAHYKGYGQITGAKYEGETSYKKLIESDDPDDFTFFVRSTLHLEGKGKIPDLGLTDVDTEHDHNEMKSDIIIGLEIKDNEVKKEQSRQINQVCK